MTGGLFDAATLESWGVVTAVYPDAEFEERSRTLALELANGPTKAHAATKAIIRAQKEGGARAADEIVPGAGRRPLRHRGPPERRAVVPHGGAGQGHLPGADSPQRLLVRADAPHARAARTRRRRRAARRRPAGRATCRPTSPRRGSPGGRRPSTRVTGLIVRDDLQPARQQRVRRVGRREQVRTKLPICISGAACWVRNRSATATAKQAIAAARRHHQHVGDQQRRRRPGQCDAQREGHREQERRRAAAPAARPRRRCPPSSVGPRDRGDEQAVEPARARCRARG